MDDPQLRSILVNIQQRLNDNDRERLDLYLLDDLSRSTRVDSKLNQTLKLIQALFDRDKIDGEQFISLIDAFQRIRCFDAVQLLKEHQRRMASKGLKKSALGLTSIMPPHNQQLEDAHEYEYIDDTKISIQYQGDYRNNNTDDTIAQKNLIINEDKEKQSFRRKPCFCVPLLKNRCFLLSSILFLLVMGLLVLGLIEGKNLLRKKEQKRNITLVRAGQKFGGDGGDPFDDSLLPKFTPSHYLSGVRFSDIDNFDACQFIYTSSDDDQNRIESDVYGNNGQKINELYKYHLTNDERIEKVQVKLLPTTFINGHTGLPFTTNIIKGLKFITTKGRSIPPNLNLTGDGVETEYFPGYTLRYVTGRSGLRIDQLQFFWYRTE